jgi:hypothetical protein
VGTKGSSDESNYRLDHFLLEFFCSPSTIAAELLLVPHTFLSPLQDCDTRSTVAQQSKLYKTQAYESSMTKAE